MPQYSPEQHRQLTAAHRAVMFLQQKGKGAISDVLPGTDGHAWKSRFISELEERMMVSIDNYGRLVADKRRLASAVNNRDLIAAMLWPKKPEQVSASAPTSAVAPPPEAPRIAEVASAEEELATQTGDAEAQTLAMLMGLYDHIEWMEKRIADIDANVKTLLKEWKG